MKRFIAMLMVALAMVAMSAFSAVPAFAGGHGGNSGSSGNIMCKEKNGGLIVVSSVLECNSIGGIVVSL